MDHPLRKEENIKRGIRAILERLAEEGRVASVTDALIDRYYQRFWINKEVVPLIKNYEGKE